jgi:hypothetical protein
MKMLDLLNESIALNNLGATLASAGDLHGAIDHIMTAAKRMHPVSKHIGMHSCCSSSSGLRGFEAPGGMRQDVHESADSLSIRFHSKSLSSAEDTFSFLQPIHIPVASQLPAACTLESAIIVFNMAILYHLQASASSLQRAAFLYDTAFNLVSALGHHTTAATIAMASLNNIAVILWATGEYAESREYLRGLCCFVHRLPSVANSTALEERRQFLLNTVFLRPPTRAGAA